MNIKQTTKKDHYTKCHRVNLLNHTIYISITHIPGKYHQQNTRDYHKSSKQSLPETSSKWSLCAQHSNLPTKTKTVLGQQHNK